MIFGVYGYGRLYNIEHRSIEEAETSVSLFMHGSLMACSACRDARWQRSKGSSGVAESLYRGKARTATNDTHTSLSAS